MEKVKVFNIKINGIKESTESINLLMAKLNELQTRIKELSKDGVKIQIGGGNIKKNVEEIDEETNTLAAMRKELARLKKELSHTELGTEEFEKLRKRTLEANEAVKKIEKSYGVFNRDVGNYANGVKTGMSSFKKEVIAAARGLVSFDENAMGVERQMKTLKKSMMELTLAGRENSQEFKLLQDTYLELESAQERVNDQINRLTSKTVGLDAVVGSFQALTAAMQIGVGVGSMFGGDSNEEMLKRIQLMQQLQAVAQGLATIQEQMAKGTGIGAMFNGIKDAFGGLGESGKKTTETINDYQKATESATKATKAFNASQGATKSAMAANEGTVSKNSTAMQEYAVAAQEASAAEQRLASVSPELVTAAKLESEGNEDLVRVFGELSKEEKEIVECAELLAMAEEKEAEAAKAASDAQEIYNKLLELGAKVNTEFVDGVEVITFQLLQEDKTVRSLIATYERLINTRNELLASAEGDRAATTDVMSNPAKAQKVNDYRKITEEEKRLEKQTEKTNKVLGEQGTVVKNVGKQMVTFSTIVKGVGKSLANLVKMAGSIIIFMVIFELIFKAIEWFKSLGNQMEETTKDIEALDAAVETLVDGSLNQLAQDRKIGRINGLQEQTGQLKAYKNALDMAKKGVESVIKEVNTQDASIWFWNENWKDMGKAEQEFKKLYESGKLLSGSYDECSKSIQLMNNLIMQFGKNGGEVGDMLRERFIKLRDSFVDLQNSYAEGIALNNESVKKTIENNIAAMREGYAKRLAELKNARDKELEEVEAGSEEYYSIIAKYNRQIAELQEQNANDEYVARKNAALKELSARQQTLNTRLKILRIELDAELREISKNNMSVETKRLQRKAAEEKYNYDVLQLKKQFYKQYSQLVAQEETKILNAELEKLNIELGKIQEAYNNVEFKFNMPKSNDLNELFEDFFNPDLDITVTFRKQEEVITKIIDARKEEYKKLLSMQTEYENKSYDIEVKKLTDEYQKQITTIKEMTLSETEKNDMLERIDTEFAERRENLDEKHYDKLIKIADDGNKKIVEINAEALKKVNQLYKDELNEITDTLNEATAQTTNSWNIVRYSYIKDELNKAKREYNGFLDSLKARKNEINELFQTGQIPFDDYKSGIDEVNDEIKKVKENIKGVNSNLLNLFGQFVESINTYVQEGLQGIATIYGAWSDMYNAELDYQMDQLEDENDRLDKILQEQEDIVEKHNDNISNIEDELSSARGDRRDQLIDALNAEKIAREKAYAEEKRIEKEKERNEKQQKALEKKQKEEQHKQQVVQAIISAALATANGLATQPFMPVGIAMGAFAASLGAAQVALIKNTKYAQGGLLEGPAHSQGGIKIPHLNAEVEGGEFVTNKVTTNKNIELLEFINSKKKRIEMTDLVEYYNNSKTVKSSSRTKFADGGRLPVMNNVMPYSKNTVNVNIPNIEARVSVEEFERVQGNMNNIRVLAGA